MPMDVLSRLFASIILLMGELAGCKNPAPVPARAPQGPDFGVPLCRPPVFPQAGTGDCTSIGCPGNSPVVNGFPINGFSKDATGACNQAGVQLIPHSLEGGHCGRGADLGLDSTGTRLIG